jgi:ABC-type Fe3+-citrate transport system substrate-binding protein
VLVGLITTIGTLVGTWFMMKFQLSRHDEQIGEIKKKISNGNGLEQQLQGLKETKLDKNRFEDVVFNGVGALQPALAHTASRLTRLESVCRERHRDHGFAGSGSGGSGGSGNSGHAGGGS